MTQAPTASLFKRLLPLGLIVLVGGLAIGFDVHKLITFENLALHREALANYVQEHRYLAILIYICVYTVAVAISLPGASFLTITGGFLFGNLYGTMATVIAATLGASCIFLAAKTALADLLRKKTQGFLAKMRDGFQENAFGYLLSLRLTPLFPFFVVNVVPALLGVRLKEYIAATFLGIIPGTFVYVSVGTGINSVFESGQEFSLSNVITPEIIIALSGLGLLSLLPIVIKKIRAKSKVK